ncbi:hypothetical protein H9P43_000709 [Blastocladiella emersonii ATCC 22665]|nr:hypothetical protein H9P43_000709 [Blastocladiella emersonii ATCC 22665]
MNSNPAAFASWLTGVVTAPNNGPSRTQAAAATTATNKRPATEPPGGSAQPAPKAAKLEVIDVDMSSSPKRAPVAEQPAPPAPAPPSAPSSSLPPPPAAPAARSQAPIVPVPPQVNGRLPDLASGFAHVPALASASAAPTSLVPPAPPELSFLPAPPSAFVASSSSQLPPLPPPPPVANGFGAAAAAAAPRPYTTTNPAPVPPSSATTARPPLRVPSLPPPPPTAPTAQWPSTDPRTDASIAGILQLAGKLSQERPAAAEATSTYVRTPALPPSERDRGRSRDRARDDDEPGAVRSRESRTPRESLSRRGSPQPPPSSSSSSYPPPFASPNYARADSAYPSQGKNQYRPDSRESDRNRRPPPPPPPLPPSRSGSTSGGDYYRSSAPSSSRPGDGPSNQNRDRPRTGSMSGQNLFSSMSNYDAPGSSGRNSKSASTRSLPPPPSPAPAPAPVIDALHREVLDHFRQLGQALGVTLAAPAGSDGDAAWSSRTLRPSLDAPPPVTLADLKTALKSIEDRVTSLGSQQLPEKMHNLHAEVQGYRAAVVRGIDAMNAALARSIKALPDREDLLSATHGAVSEAATTVLDQLKADERRVLDLHRAMHSATTRKVMDDLEDVRRDIISKTTDRVLAWIQDAMRDVVKDTVRDAVRDTVRETVKDTVHDAVKDSVRDMIEETVRDAVKDATRASSALPPRPSAPATPAVGGNALTSMRPALPPKNRHAQTHEVCGNCLAVDAHATYRCPSETQHRCDRCIVFGHRTEHCPKRSFWEAHPDAAGTGVADDDTKQQQQQQERRHASLPPPPLRTVTAPSRARSLASLKDEDAEIYECTPTFAWRHSPPPQPQPQSPEVMVLGDAAGPVASPAAAGDHGMASPSRQRAPALAVPSSPREDLALDVGETVVVSEDEDEAEAAEPVPMDLDPRPPSPPPAPAPAPAPSPPRQFEVQKPASPARRPFVVTTSPPASPSAIRTHGVGPLASPTALPPRAIADMRLLASIPPSRPHPEVVCVDVSEDEDEDEDEQEEEEEQAEDASASASATPPEEPVVPKVRRPSTLPVAEPAAAAVPVPVSAEPVPVAQTIKPKPFEHVRPAASEVVDVEDSDSDADA